LKPSDPFRSLPAWLKTEGAGTFQTTSFETRKSSFIKKTLSDITVFLRDTLFTSEWVRERGLLQGMDPRAKLLGVLFFIITVSIMRTINPLLSLYILSVILAIASNIKVFFFIKRVWFFIPFFAGVIAIPSLFLVPGKPILSFLGLTITGEGITTAAIFVLRVATSVSFLILLILTTKWDHILKALRVFHVPPLFILILSMTYRYIYLLIYTIEDMHISLLSRTIKRHTPKEGQRWIAGRIGFIFYKSRRLSGEVYDAMVSRGFQGDVSILDTFRMKGVDYLWLSISLGVLIMQITS
jgi:cobalt/nickel transport system permease protein